MTADADKRRWLLQFRKPSLRETTALRELLSHATIAENGGRGRENRRREDAKIGKFDEILPLLIHDLESDYAENMAASNGEPWDFDYVVTDETANKGAVEIYTRLFHPIDSKLGNIFYGRTVKRIGENEYLLWIDS